MDFRSTGKCEHVPQILKGATFWRCAISVAEAEVWANTVSDRCPVEVITYRGHISMASSKSIDARAAMVSSDHPALN